MNRLRSVAVVVLLLSYGAVGARQPAVRGSVPLPVPAQTIATALGLPSANHATLLLHVVRLVFDGPDGQGAQSRRLRDGLRAALAAPATKPKTAELVPLPLDRSIWRDTILQAQVPDDQLVGAILSDRRFALLYHGLAAMDDETLAWLGPERDILLHLRKHPAIVAAFGRSIHVRGGRVLVPGGAEAEPVWKALTGADPGKPSAFVQRVFRDDGRLAFLYDSVAHLDPARQRFALGLQFRSSSRDDRLRAVLDAFTLSAPEWRADEHPFVRPPLDGAMLFSTMGVTPEGDGAQPIARRIWDRVFRDDQLTDLPFSAVSQAEVQQVSETIPIDTSWLATRVLRVPYALGRRRLDTLLFAQRVFSDTEPAQAAQVATALRGFAAMPALMLSLERAGLRDPAVFARAAQHAALLNDIGAIPLRRSAILEFQSAIAIIERARRTGVLEPAPAAALVTSLCALDVSPQSAYGARFPRWMRDDLVAALPPGDGSTAEDAVIGAMAGMPRSPTARPIVEWEGRKYRVDPAGAELRRLREVRERQGGLSLDDAIAAALSSEADGGAETSPRRGATAAAEHALADTLASIAYAAHLGDPGGPAVTSGNVALRHDLALVALPVSSRSAAAWRLPIEHFDGKSWRIRGSLLGLEAAMGRLALRRLDPTEMPAEPRLAPQDRQALMLAIALLDPSDMTDVARDEIAASIARGRAKAGALSGDPKALDEVARAAGLSEWRRQALAWTVAQEPERAASQFSLLELFWLGGPRPAASKAADAWGATPLPLTGCLCLEMPKPRAWEEAAGRASVAVLATRAADVELRVADTLATLRLPAMLAPGISAYAMQDVIERAQPAYPDDWEAFGRAAMSLPRERMLDYVAALAANGPLVPIDRLARKQ